jgi:outer membrane lipoprotein-sorting protein
MRGVQRLASLALVVFAAAGTAFAQARAQLPDMSADMVSSASGRETQGKFYTSKGRIRIESGRGTVMIMDPAHDSGWMLQPERKVAMDMGAQMKAGREAAGKIVSQGPVDPNNPCAVLKGTNCKKLGTETVNDRQTQKWELKDEDGKTVNVWIDPKLWLAVKTQTPDYTGEFRNIKEGPQPESLFQVPADYQKVSRPGGPG